MDQNVLIYIINIILFAGLLTEAIIDILKKQIWMPLICMEFPLLFLFNCAAGRADICLLVVLAVSSLIFYLVSVLSREQIGKGDVFLFSMAGAGVGLPDFFILLYLTFLLAFPVAIFFLTVKKTGRKKTMPLAPFVLAAYLLLLCSGAFE